MVLSERNRVRRTKTDGLPTTVRLLTFMLYDCESIVPGKHWAEVSCSLDIHVSIWRDELAECCNARHYGYPLSFG